MFFNVIKGIPEWINENYEDALFKMNKPTFISLDYGKEKTILISTLIHGNEESGFLASIDKLREIKDKYPFNILFFFGNPRAAQYEEPFKYRFIDGEPDFNRVWIENITEESAEIMEFLKTLNLVAHIDIHNNTGKNPMYTIVMDKKKETLELASLFSDKCVFYDYNYSSFDEFTSNLCTALTIEVGKNKEQESHRNAKFCIDRFLDFYSNKEVEKFEMKIYKNPKSVRIKPGIDFGFNGQDFKIRKDFEFLNFQKVPKGNSIGQAKEIPVIVERKGEDFTEEYFEVKDNHVITKKDIIPIMATSNIDNIKKTCFFFIVEC